jgi:prophage tail gpP-like protein
MSRIIVKNVTSGRELLWRHIRIKKSLDDICHTLELEIPSSERTKVHKHERIEVRYENSFVRDSGGKRLVTTVLIDEITASADVAKHSIMVIGRSPARDIIDSTWSSTPPLLINKTLYEITKNIADKFGIACANIPTNRGDPTENVTIFLWENESPWTKLITEADSQGFIITANEAGGLYIWQPEGTVRQEGFHLTEGRNIKTIEWKENGAEQYHEYIVSGGFREPVSVIDSTCKNNRVLTINLTNPIIEPEKLRRRAETEMRRRRENRVTVTVSGWGLTDTQIKNLGSVTAGKEIFWVPNLLIPVSMPSLGLRANLLIAEVEQEAGEETMSSTITLVNREAYL